MDCRAAKPLLQELHDGALGKAPSGELAAHLRGCKDCARELSALKSLSSLFAALPRRPLPRGFLARLERRRSAPAAPRAEAWRPRAWAFALGSLMVGAVVYRSARPGPEPEGFAPPLAVAPPGAGAAGAASGLDGAAQAPASAMSPPPPTFRSLKAAGTPVGAKRAALTNEQLHAKLQDESDRLGIEAISPQEEERYRPFLGTDRLGRASTRAEAEVSIRQIAALRRAVEDARGEAPPVALEGRTAPVLAEGTADGGRALEEAAPAEPASGGEQSWSGPYAGDLEGGRTASDEKAWKALWARISRAPAPRVDFKTRQVVAVFLGRRPSAGHSVEIVSVEATESSLVVRYRESVAPGAALPESPSSPYAAKAVPRSDLPVRFEKLP